MNRTKLLLVILMITLCSTSHSDNDFKFPDTIPAELHNTILNHAKEFGISNVESVSILRTCMLRHESIIIRGDEQLLDSKGRYKELHINWRSIGFGEPDPNQNTITLDECELRIIEFVELDIQKKRKRIIVRGIDLDDALQILIKFYSGNYSCPSSVDKASQPSNDELNNPEVLMLQYDAWFKPVYMLDLISNHDIFFYVNSDNITIKEYSWAIKD